MRPPPRRTCPPCWATALTAGVILLALTPLHAAPDAARRTRILVTSPLGQVGAAPGRVTLADALAQAAGDPTDNVIEFDPSVFTAAEGHIQLRNPLLFESNRTGWDAIDGSAGGAVVVIDATACNDAGIVVGGDAQLTLSGLTVRGGQQRVLLAKDNARITLERVVLREGSMPGLALFGKANATLRYSRLTDNRTHGLELHGQATASLEQVALGRNRQAGIACFEEASVTARDCHLEENGEWAAVLTDRSRMELTACTLRKSRFASADVSGAARLLCRDCAIEDSLRFGVFATGDSTVELIASRVRANGSRGIELQDAADLLVEQTHVQFNADYGIILFGRASIGAKGSTISHNGAHGVSLRGLATGVFANCSFVGNRYSGIGCLDGHDGGDVKITQCTFAQNGMRPIYRGPLHLDPLVPTPLRIEQQTVRCLAEAGAEIELYLDRAGEAARYLRTVRADNRGLFEIDTQEIPQGWVMTAAATVEGSTSEFNVIGGTAPGPVLEALLGRTGPLSDDGGETNFDAVIRRWKPHTHLVLNIENSPSLAVERYLRFLVQRIPDWTAGSVTGSAHLGPVNQRTMGATVIPIRYVSPDAAQLFGRGGVTFMKWDAGGYFVNPMEIVLAIGRDPQESCPRVLAHEVGHALGLCHARVGLLSRMQGSAVPSQAFVNDFSPMMTFYDVLALQILHDRSNASGLTLRKLVQRGVIPPPQVSELTAARPATAEPTFSPPPVDRAQPPLSNRP